MHELQVNVRFGETDALGHINNTSYFIYLEEARVKYFETLGYSMDVKKWPFILASTKCDFLSQGYFNQILTIKTWVSRVGGKSFQLDHEIVCSQTNEVIARGHAIVVYFDFNKQESATIPDLLREGLRQNLIE
ncbi:acyl-CoA thioesterase [Bacillus sp. ISL-47]|uniref:acyl-CoA thioesterase n=1 Tax=Bacillus sp. ISL-47 TaxID=2819130 RepID=UPI001BE8856A|nr:thioesterase family protein [Bacillus sp. ISL-47]MBT2688702.1 acyl-CoA thioesterase [Bacillus sp. ISL-47]MBT2707398.1 acyl-CoA thioesterase [Pseudomonas sp. ISL-84]